MEEGLQKPLWDKASIIAFATFVPFIVMIMLVRLRGKEEGVGFVGNGRVVKRRRQKHKVLLSGPGVLRRCSLDKSSLKDATDLLLANL